ncbi:uncharacterized protein LOC110689530 [Chenopodium quinoa]|uniref:uncharacterized protein LOC110689530 n=1 Tax=Chenopodium quinoa TaxID=63459 RepID=UPI000B76E300|nr:uncharacterized protein LOC110689530 [Chenopodium quinoa]
MVNRYAVYAGYNIRWFKVEKNKKMEARCKSGCEWKLYASWDGEHKSFVVSSCNPENTCNRADYENLQAKAGWFAKEYLQKYIDNPNWSRKELEKDVMERFGVRLSKWNCYRVKTIAHKLLHGNLFDHYSQLATYLSELKKSDVDNQMFPVAWGVVEAENNDSWSWFLETLKLDMPDFGGEDSTVISDQHKHKKHGGDELKKLFWRAVYAYTKADHEKALKEMKTISPAAVEDFIKQKPQAFCRYGFRTVTKCNLVVNNLAETFNGWILEAISKPIIHMLEDIRRALMERLFKKKTLMERAKDIICPRIRKRLEKNKEYAKCCTVLASGRTEFEVLHGMEVLVVNLDLKTCTCRRWDLHGFPCCHVIAACNWLRVPCEDYVDASLTKARYLQAYSGSIKPLRGENH